MTQPQATARKPLVASRIVEQGVLGLGSLALAHYLGVDRFAAPSVVLMVNSLAVTLADLGLGTDVLRLEVDQRAATSRLRQMRAINLALAIACVVGSTLLAGSAAAVVVGAGLIWPVAAESYVRKSGSIRRGAIRSVVAGEIAGAIVLALGIGLACAQPASAVAWVTTGLVGKSVVEAALARHWRSCFAVDGVKGDQLALWLAQLVAYGIANLDFLAVGLLVGERAFAVYALAFRLSNALPSQLAYVAGRTASVDLASRPGERAAVYIRYMRPLFLAGLGAMVLTMLAGPVAAWLLGDDWSVISWVLVVLALAIPWRMVLGLGGTVLIVARRSALLLRVELIHLILLGGSLAAGGLIGFGPLVGVAAAGSVLAVLGYHLVATRVSGIKWWAPSLPLAVLSLAAIVALAGQVSLPE